MNVVSLLLLGAFICHSCDLLLFLFKREINPGIAVSTGCSFSFFLKDGLREKFRSVVILNGTSGEE